MFDLYRAEDSINQQEILISLMQNKMKDEYIIINKTAIQKRIEELEKEKASNLTQNLVGFANQNEGEIVALKQILSQSTPLIPEIGKAYEAGKLDGELSKTFDNPKGRYISNLKLDI